MGMGITQIGDAIRIYQELMKNEARQMSIEVPGYKDQRMSSEAMFTDMLSASSKSSDMKFPLGQSHAIGTKLTGMYTIATRGELERTDNPLDLAVLQQGAYLGVILPDNKKGFTRDGRLTLDRNRQIVTHGGYPLAQNIVIPQDIPLSSIKVDDSGNVLAPNANNDGYDNLGQIMLYVFPNEQALDINSSGIHMANDRSGDAIEGAPRTPGFGELVNGMLEKPNTDKIGMIIRIQELSQNSMMLIGALKEQIELNKHIADIGK